MSALADPPTTLPGVTSLSLSSFNLAKKCPLKWKRRYLDNEYEPPSGKMLLGSAVGAAESANYQAKITSEVDLPLDDVLDCFSDEWEERIEREDVDFEGDAPGDLKDSGAKALSAYHTQIAPAIQPVAVERPFLLRFPGVDWTFKGFLDLEEANGTVSDLKVKAKKLSIIDARVDPQPTSYMLARRTEGQPATGFNFHTMVRTKTPYAEVVSTERTDRELDTFVTRIFAVAAELAWRAEHDVWEGAPPGAWWCSEKMCGYWHTCPMGGGAR